ncbi:uncharacterized protein LOC119702410 [Motacilla alba alba]|uniref:uncharacterized protein LOC119702410 n=1 Tax=Motacilla alba alba TaxID=1094192 RepID=UPI0018D5676D|nr:uncharacterized protein LOC119702410 [Motacilla alba alba]
MKLLMVWDYCYPPSFSLPAWHQNCEKSEPTFLLPVLCLRMIWLKQVDFAAPIYHLSSKHQHLIITFFRMQHELQKHTNRLGACGVVEERTACSSKFASTHLEECCEKELPWRAGERRKLVIFGVMVFVSLSHWYRSVAFLEMAEHPSAHAPCRTDYGSDTCLMERTPAQRTSKRRCASGSAFLVSTPRLLLPVSFALGSIKPQTSLLLLEILILGVFKRHW